MIVFCLMISQKIVSDIFLMISMLLFSALLSWFSNYVACINSIVLGPRNTPSLIFSSLIGGNLFFKIYKSSPILIHCLDVQWR